MYAGKVTGRQRQVGSQELDSQAGIYGRQVCRQAERQAEAGIVKIHKNVIRKSNR